MASHLKFDPDLEDRIKKEIATGACLDTICAKAGASYYKVRMVAQKYGLSVMRKGSKGRPLYLKSDLKLERKIVRAIAAGECASVISAKVGVPYYRVHMVAQKHGLIVMRKGAKGRPFNLKSDLKLERKIKKAIAAGECVNTICAKFGVSQYRVRVVAQRYGLIVKREGAKGQTLRILYLLLCGQGYSQIARQTGGTRQRVEQIRREAEDVGFVISVPPGQGGKHMA